MQRRVNSLLLCFICLTSLSVFSQVRDNNELLSYTNNVSNIDLRSKDLVGTPYISKDHAPAKFSLNGNIYPMRYNGYQDEMEIEKEGNLFNLKKEIGSKITFLNENKIYSVYNFSEDNQPKVGFFVLLFESDKISFLIKEKVKFYEEVEAKTGYDKYKPPTLKRENDIFYISYDNKTAIQTPRKKKEILALFSDKANDVESYAKKNKLGFSKKDDLIKICTYYSTL